MAEYLIKEALVLAMTEECKNCEYQTSDYCDECDWRTAFEMIADLPSVDVQPLSVVAEHVKKRLYETAFNTSEAVARNAIADMAERIDFWINELREGDTNG